MNTSETVRKRCSRSVHTSVNLQRIDGVSTLRISLFLFFFSPPFSTLVIKRLKEKHERCLIERRKKMLTCFTIIRYVYANSLETN